MATYLDCNATTPLEPSVIEAVRFYQEQEFGNAGSRTHGFGAAANTAVQQARQKIANVVSADKVEVLFTSGATESNNLAILGLAAGKTAFEKKHIVSTTIEHKAVLEPLEVLAEQGFEVTLVPVDRSGRVSADDVMSAVRDDTLLVSVMQANNETGVLQPVGEIAQGLGEHDSYFHVDAAQGFGKELNPLKNPRIDLISISGHKIFGPKGIGALVNRRRGYQKAPLQPLIYGGGQEQGLRPGTLPVPLIVGLGIAAEMAEKYHEERRAACQLIREQALDELSSLKLVFNGDQNYVMPHVMNISIPGVDAEAAMVALKDIAAISNGSACTSHSYMPSHVLEAIGLDEDAIQQSLRISWCHMTGEVDWVGIRERLTMLRQ